MQAHKRSLILGLSRTAEGAVCLLWAGASLLLGLVAWRLGVAPLLALGGVALAVAPAAATLALRNVAGWREPWTAFAWNGFAALAAGATGGFASPMAASFILAPAFARGGAQAAEAAFFAALGFVAAGLVGVFGTGPVAAGPLPAMGAGLSLLCAGALVAMGRRAAPYAAPVRAAPVAKASEAESATATQRQRIAELSHELRTPLTHIIGFADVMRQRLFGPLHDKYGEYVELIHTSGQNLLDLVNRLLDLSRIEAGRFQLQREEFDVSLIAEEVIRLSMDAARGKNIALQLEPVNLPLKVNADVAAMRQIMINLIGNALKFTPVGGAVRLRVYAHEGRLRIEVQDNGPGIPPAERARLGSAFERGASGAAAEGYGLGLSLVRAFAELHGGALSFHDAPGGGALVRVEMPVFA